MNLLPFTASTTIPENESYEINGLNKYMGLGMENDRPTNIDEL